MLRSLRRLREDERGITLAELLVYSVLLTLVIALAGGMLIRTLVTQRDTTAINQASNNGQVAVRQIERTLRNATEIYLPSAHGGNVMVVKTRVAEDGTLPASWQCRAYHFDGASGELRTVTGPATGTPVTAGLSSTVNSSSWRVLLSGVVATPNGATTHQVFESEALGGAKIKFDVEAGSTDNRVSFATTVIPREQGPTSGVSCT